MTRTAEQAKLAQESQSPSAPLLLIGVWLAHLVLRRRLEPKGILARSTRRLRCRPSCERLCVRVRVGGISAAAGGGWSFTFQAVGLSRPGRGGSRQPGCLDAMSAENLEPASAEEQKEMEDKVISPEKAEEAKLKARYPHLGQKPGGSDFLRKRLQKGQKYFDSGDYNMAKAKMKNKQLPTAAPDKTEVTGDHIPTPQDLPQRKPSLVASKLAG